MRKLHRLWLLPLISILTAGILFSCREADPPPPTVPVPSPEPPAPRVQPFLELIAGDAVLYLGARDWRDFEVFDFIETARRLRIVDRFRELAGPELPDLPDRAEADRRLRELSRLREEISLRDLLGGEWALAVFRGGPEGLLVPALILRLPEGRGDLYTDYIHRLAARSLPEGEESGDEGEFLGLELHSFPVPGLEHRVVWCRSEDILIAALGRERVEEIAARLLGRGEGRPLAADEAFLGSFTGLDLAGRGVLYLRVHPLTGRIAGELSREYPETSPDGLPLPEREEAGYYLRGARRVIETVDRMAGVFDYDSTGYREEVRYFLDEERGSRALLDLLRREPRVWEVLDYIPEGAADVTAGFFEPEKIYRPLLNFLADGPRGDPDLRELWAEKQAEAGIRVEEDILSWLGDEFAFCSVSLGTSLFDPGSWAFFLRYTSAEQLDLFLDELLARAREAELNVVAEEYEGIGFHVLYLPLPLFPVTPTAGRVGDFLVLASRKDVFTGVVDIQAGRKPSIRANPDFRRLEAELGTEGSEIVFSRLEDKIEATIATIRSSAAMLGLFLPPPGAEDADGEPLGPDSRQVMDLMNDFTRVLEDLKIFRFRGGVSRYRDGYIESRTMIEIGD